MLFISVALLLHSLSLFGKREKIVLKSINERVFSHYEKNTFITEISLYACRKESSQKEKERLYCFYFDRVKSPFYCFCAEIIITINQRMQKMNITIIKKRTTQKIYIFPILKFKNFNIFIKKKSLFFLNK